MSINDVEYDINVKEVNFQTFFQIIQNFKIIF